MDAAYTGNIIAQLRKEKGLTQKELAVVLFVTDKAVSKWERGINFPELSLLEKLAQALDTTPSHLLGIEEATHEEIITSFTQISAEQAHETKDDLCKLAWLGLIIAIALVVVSKLMKVEYQMQSIINVFSLIMVGCCIYLLFKHGAIKKFGTLDILLVYALGLSVLVYLGIQFFSGHGPTIALACVLICIISGSIQLLFYRIMTPPSAKIAPLIISGIFAVWSVFGYLALHTWSGTVGDLFAYKFSPFISCAVVWITCRCLDKNRTKLNIKKLCLFLLTALVLTLYLGRDYAVQLYVRTFESRLEDFAVEQLSQVGDSHPDSYGLWKISVLSEDSMVEFHTGGSGLAPSSTYKGFYYSPDDTHKAFGGADVHLEIKGDTATWLEMGTDNHGVSIRITENWFWYEASF